MDQISQTTEKVVSGLSKDQTAHNIIVVLSMILCAGMASLLTYLVFDSSHKNNQSYLDALNKQLQSATMQVKEFNASMTIINTNLGIIKNQAVDMRKEINDLEKDVRDHEKRLIKIESKR